MIPLILGLRRSHGHSEGSLEFIMVLHSLEKFSVDIDNLCIQNTGENIELDSALFYTT